MRAENKIKIQIRTGIKRVIGLPSENEAEQRS